MTLGDRFGGHRVLEPKGALPKAATQLDNQTPPFDNEIGIRVTALHITATSFNRMWKEAHQEREKFIPILNSIINQYGKCQDPVTGSGGVLMGKVDFIGSALNVDLQVGDAISSMVSLAMTPLRLNHIGEIKPELGQVEVDGHAILFESGLWAKLPEDLPEHLALMALDVAGAPAYAAKHVHAGQRVLVIGGGKAGLLTLHEAKKRIGVTGQVLLVEKDPARGAAAKSLELADEVIIADACNGLEVMNEVERLTAGKLADITINCASVPGTEMSAILSTRDDGKIIFFSMATDFSRAALGAEGAGKPVEMVIGNGYIPGHARIALQVLRENAALREYLNQL
jgi:L-erythro-3,5-diaminohexanoate dehydrogenase